MICSYVIIKKDWVFGGGRETYRIRPIFVLFMLKFGGVGGNEFLI